MKSEISSESTHKPSQPMKQTTSSVSDRLTRYEIDALRLKKKQLSDYYRKMFAERKHKA